MVASIIEWKKMMAAYFAMGVHVCVGVQYLRACCFACLREKIILRLECAFVAGGIR